MHGFQNAFDALEDLGDTTVGEECSEESGDFLVLRIVVSVNEFEGIGVDIACLVELCVQGVEMGVEGLSVHIMR